MEFQVSAFDTRREFSSAAASPPGHGPQELDFLVTAGPGHTVDDLAAALETALSGAPRPPGRPSRAEPPELWLDGMRLAPAAALGSTGIRAGARLGIGGPPPDATPAHPGERRARHSRGGTGHVAELRVVGGPDAGLAVPLAPGTYVIGREGDIPLTEQNVSRQHARITVTATGAEITSLPQATNGTGLDGVPLRPGHPTPVRPGQVIAAGHDRLTIALTGDHDAITIERDPRDPFGFSVNRPPRSPAVLPAPVVIDLSGQHAVREQSQPWPVMLIAPALAAVAGVVIALVSGQWLFLLFSVAGVAGTLGTQLYSRHSTKAKARQAALTAQDAATAGGDRLAAAIEAEGRLLRDALPDIGQVLRIATGPGTRLWERRPLDADFLRLRAGTADLPASTVTVRGAGTPGAGAGPDGAAADPVVRDVPVPVSLRDVGVLGIAGPAQASRPALAWAVAQVAALHSPGDVRLVLLTEHSQAWRWARWLPHLRPLSDVGDQLSVGSDPESVAALAASVRELIDRRRAADGQRGSYGRGFAGRGPQSPPELPVVVVILDGAYRLRRQANLDALLADGPAAGVYVICCDDDWRALPDDCRGLLHTDPASGGSGIYRDHDREVAVARLDRVTGQWTDEMARALAPIRGTSGGQQQQAGLPGSVRLLDLWGIGQPDATTMAGLWRRAGRSTVVPIGQSASGLFTLDLVHDGPHFLLGGFTGSGKSEFLRTLVASLVLGNTPDELTFALIDYKGGAGFARFGPMPHVTGYLTDLDEYGGVRALAALGAEIRYRLGLLNRAGCESIEDYNTAGRPLGPLPRLVIVIDEFRFLAEQMPEFLPGLIDVAARGRSVGMHLVLATQRPNSVVKQDLLANIGLRLCLRVQEPADSIAVVDIPDAALIGQDQKGRGYARAGHGSATLFQGAYVRGTAPGQVRGGADTALLVRPWPFGTMLTTGSAASGEPGADGPGRTDLDALVQAAREAGWPRPARLAWLPPLPGLIPLHQLPAPSPARGGLPPVAYGVEDLPARQAQQVLTFDLERGSHLLVGGAPESGRTTVLRTIAAQIGAGYSPSDVHVYVLDCGDGALLTMAGLPHCGAAVRRNDKERVARLLDRLAAEVARRQDVLAAAGFDSVTEQRARGRDPMPYMVLLLDRLEGFAEDLGDYDNSRLPGLLARLLSEGASAGLRVLATGDKGALIRQASSYPARLVLRLGDTGDYTGAGVPRGAMPSSPPPGRGVFLPAGTTVQVAFPSLDGSGPQASATLDAPGEDPASGSAQAQALGTIISAAQAASPRPSPAPLRVDPLPGRISLAEAGLLPRALAGGGQPGDGPMRPAAAVGGDDLAFLGIDLDRFSGFLISGPMLSGRSNALLVVAESLLAAGTPVVVLAPKPSPVEKLEGRAGVIEVVKTARPDKGRLLAHIMAAGDGPLVVLADDAEALYGQAVEAELAELAAAGRGRRKAIVAAGATSSIAHALRTSFTTAIRQSRSGLLLTPEAPQLGRDLFGVQLPRSAAFDRPEGRGYLIQPGRATLVQVPKVT